LAIEGFSVTKEEEDMISKRLNGDMSEGEYSHYDFDFIVKEKKQIHKS
jgi:hypothetical protein